MENPFEIISRRLSTIEELLLDLKHKPATITTGTNAGEVLTITQAADFLDLTTQTIYGLVSARKIPFSKPTGSRLYFSRLELIEWLKSNRTATAQEQAQQYDLIRSARQPRRGGRKV